jgi:hypothetical protein
MVEEYREGRDKFHTEIPPPDNGSHVDIQGEMDSEQNNTKFHNERHVHS